jgi:2-dehydropantoate 2-reductase
MRFVVYGAGAIGGLVGARLAGAGESVMLIARGDHGAAIRAHGLAVDSAAGRQVFELPVASDPADASLGPDDVVLLGMKSQDTVAALDALRQVAGPATPVACLQNGVDNERAALRRFERVYPVCVMCPAAHLEPGVVQAFSSPIPGLLDVGCYPAGVDDTSTRLVQAFEAAGFDSVERPDIMRWKYTKLLMNLGNAVEAVLRAPGRSRIRAMARDEGIACLHAAGIDFASAEEDANRRGDLLNLQPIGDSARSGGSSWQSLERGSGSIESDYLNGEIALLGRLYAVPTPVNVLLQELANDLARRRVRPGALTADEFLQRLAVR